MSERCAARDCPGLLACTLCPMDPLEPVLDPVRREGPAEPFTWKAHDPGPRPDHVKRRG